MKPIKLVQNLIRNIMEAKIMIDNFFKFKSQFKDITRYSMPYGVLFLFKAIEVWQKPVSFWIGSKNSKWRKREKQIKRMLDVHYDNPTNRLVYYDNGKIQFPFSVYCEKDKYVLKVWDYDGENLLIKIRGKYKNSLTKFKKEDLKKVETKIKERSNEISRLLC